MRAEVREKLLEAPVNACTCTWLPEGRKATLAWLAAYNIHGVVDTFDDWMSKNGPAARVLLEGAPKSREKGAA